MTKRKPKTLDNFLEEHKQSKLDQRLQVEAEKREADNYYYLDYNDISDECYNWWKVVLKSYGYKEHDSIPVWMKDLFQKW